jgi:hypothetical protein
MFCSRSCCLASRSDFFFFSLKTNARPLYLTGESEPGDRSRSASGYRLSSQVQPADLKQKARSLQVSSRLQNREPSLSRSAPAIIIHYTNEKSGFVKRNEPRRATPIFSPCRSRPAPRGWLSPKYRHADIRVAQSGCDRRRDLPPGRSF